MSISEDPSEDIIFSHLLITLMQQVANTGSIRCEIMNGTAGLIHIAIALPSIWHTEIQSVKKRFYGD